MRCEVRVGASRRGQRCPARAVEARLQIGDRTGVERTQNGQGGGSAYGAVPAGASGMHGEEARLRLGARARAKRTSNMPYMLVTLDVSQLETSASTFRNL